MIGTAEETLHWLLDSAAEGIFGLDLQGNCTFCNATVARLLGYPNPADLVGRPLHPLIHHKRADGSPYPYAECQICQAFRQGDRVHIAGEVFWCPDGTQLTVEYWSNPVRRAGEIVGCVVTFLDLSERWRVSERLRLIESAVAHAHDAVVITTPDLDYPGPEIIYVNPAHERMTGFATGEMLGKTPRILQGRRTNRGVLNRLRQQLGAGKSFLGQVVNYRKDGSEFVAELRIEPVRDAGGRLTHWVAIEADVTDQLRVERELQHHRERLEELVSARTAELKFVNEELSQYAHIVSHDLRAPLRAIHNYADFLREDLGDALGPEQQGYLDGLCEAVRHGEDLVLDLLELSRVGQRADAVFPIDMGNFLRDLLAELKLPQDVETTVAERWPRVLAEPLLLRQICVNLIENAVKFNDSSPKRLDFGWRPVSDKMCEVFVRDNGIGVDPRYHKKIFGVFERLHTHEDYEGTGVGLAIVKKAAGKLGGSVRVASVLGQGSVFSVSLRLAGEET